MYATLKAFNHNPINIQSKFCINSCVFSYIIRSISIWNEIVKQSVLLILFCLLLSSPLPPKHLLESNPRPIACQTWLNRQIVKISISGYNGTYSCHPADRQSRNSNIEIGLIALIHITLCDWPTPLSLLLQRMRAAVHECGVGWLLHHGTPYSPFTTLPTPPPPVVRRDSHGQWVYPTSLSLPDEPNLIISTS